MGKVQSAYDVLRLPYDAPSSQVRSRYRQLLRRHQPDLERQDLFQDEACLHLVRSYLVVESPGRVEYTRLVRASRGAPVAVFVLLPGLVCFWVGVVFYAIAAYLDEHASISIVMALALTAALTAAFCFIYRDARLAFFVFGGNFIWAGLNLGWMIGSLRRTGMQEE